MITPADKADGLWSLAGKLKYLRARLTRDGDKPPTTRDLASRTADEAGKPALDHTVIHATLSGTKTNPPLKTLLGLAHAFDCPPPYLMPGEHDLTSLEVYYEHPAAREALRLVAELGDSGADALLQAARALREARGLDTATKTRRRGRLSRAEAAEASFRETELFLNS
nr:hypothetical protein KitaXyl93_23620 [Kitasatospora sp. Xyl93]